MKAKKSKNLTIRLLFAVFIMQVYGFISICVMKYNMDLVSIQYRNLETKSNTALMSIESIKASLYQHENHVAYAVLFADERTYQNEMKTASSLRDQTENQLIECDLAFRDLGDYIDYDDFDELHTSTVAYFNCVDMLSQAHEYDTNEVAIYTLNNKLMTYINMANETMETLSDKVNDTVANTKTMENTQIQNTRIVFSASVIIYFIGTIVCMNFCWRVMGEQEQLRLDAELANQAKSAFLSNMSHEIRTPINAIIGMNEMIKRESNDPQVLDYSERIRSSSNGLLGIVNDVLDFSKIEAGKMDLVPDNYDLQEVILDVWNMISVRAANKGLEFSYNGDPEVPRYLYGDSVRVKQIIVNLLTNAVKYTKEGSVVLAIKAEAIADGTVSLRFASIDTGMGINPEEIDKLTKPFARIDERKNIGIEGTGLGLSIVNNLLALMDSKLEITSTYGKGSTFFFTIEQKMQKSDKMGAFNPEEYHVEHVEKDEAILHASKAMVLGVDDNEMNRMVLKELLKRTGVQLDLASGGKEAVQMANEKVYDIILMDHRMPEIDGVQAMHMIKEDSLNRKTPILVVTANALNGAEEEYLAEGFTGCLKKPIEGRQLEKAMLDLLPEDKLDSDEDMAVAIDKAAGIKACGGEELYNKVIKDFVFGAKASMDELNQLKSHNDVANYTIKVHALKSNARLAGANALSAEAKELEALGDQNKWEEIVPRHGVLMVHYQAVVDALRAEYDLKETHENGPIDTAYFLELLDAIKESSEAFDCDSIDRAVEELNKYDLPDPVTDLFTELQNAAFAVEVDKIVVIVDQMKERVQG